MNLDPTQASLVIILAYCLRDGIILALAFILIGKIVNAQSCRYPVMPPPVPVPIPPGPIPPDPIPPVPVARTPRFVNITATSFAGPNDSVASSTSAYDGHIIRGATELAAALPYHFPKPPIIRVFANGHSVDVPTEDVGPWNTNDPYWTTNTRPMAEAQFANKTKAQNGQVPSNPAGLDCTPAVWKALGFTGDLEQITATVSWDFVDYLGATEPPGPTPPIIDGLIKQSWPTQADCPTFYGSPSQVVASLVKVHCPWVLSVEGTQSQNITIHAKCAPSLTRVLNYIWQQCGQSQAKIHEFGYDVFDGSYNPRNIGGTNTPSVHSYAAAMDWNAAANPQHAPLSQTKFKSDSLIVFAFEAEGWIWGGRWTPASIDAMHFQAARVR